MNPYLLCAISLFWVGAGLSASAPGIVGGDAPELTAAAFHLGSAHAPGYPLYITLGHLFQLLPVGTPAFRMTLLSILVQTAAFMVLAGLFRGLLRQTWSVVQREFLSLGAACLVMAGPLVFRQLVSPEVMALQFLLTALFLRLVLFPSPSKFQLVGFLSGLALAHHHLTFLMLPALAWAYRGEFKDPKKVLQSLTLFIAGFSLYLILPLRAVQSPLVNWGNPTDFDQLFFHIGRGQYGGNITGGRLIDGFWDLALYLKGYFFEVPVLGVLLVLTALWKNRDGLRTEYFLGAGTLFVLLPFLIRAPYEPENNYVNETFLPPAILWLSPLLLKGMEWVYEKPLIHRRVLATGFLALFTAVLYLSHRGNHSTRDLAVEDVSRNILMQMPARSVLFSEGDAVTFPLAYLKLVLNLRPDLEIFDRMGGLFRDIYRTAEHRKRAFLSPPELVALEREYLGKNRHPFVFYSENSTAPGIPLTMTGLLFKSAGDEGTLVPEERMWRSFRTPRVAPNHDFFSRETGARFHIFKATFDLDRRGERALGIEDIGKVKKLAHDNSRLWINLGVLESDHGWIDQAALTFERVSRLAPGNFLAWYDRGITANAQNRNSDAIDFLKKAIELNPAYAQAHHHLGFQYYKAQRFEEAVQEWETTLRLDPMYPETYRNLGFMYLRSRPDQAVQMFGQYLALYPNSPYRAEIEKQLSNLKRR